MADHKLHFKYKNGSPIYTHDHETPPSEHSKEDLHTMGPGDRIGWKCHSPGGTGTVCTVKFDTNDCPLTVGCDFAIPFWNQGPWTYVRLDAAKPAPHVYTYTLAVNGSTFDPKIQVDPGTGVEGFVHAIPLVLALLVGITAGFGLRSFLYQRSKKPDQPTQL